MQHYFSVGLFCVAFLLLPQSCSSQSSFFDFLSNSKLTDQINSDKQDTKTNLESIPQTQKQQPELTSIVQPITENINIIPVNSMPPNVLQSGNISLGKIIIILFENSY